MTNPILLDESLLDEVFIPERLAGREGQAKEIARYLKPALSGKSVRNIIVSGPPGVGKTIVCRWLLKEYFPRNSAFVNCWSKRTTHKIIEEVLLQQGAIVHGKESTSELVKKFEKSGKRPIVCLDEWDHAKDPDILYILARNSCGVVLISNNSHSLYGMDSRIASSLFLHEIEFKSYDRDEISSILRERAAFAIRAGSIDPSLFSVLAGMCRGDARVALQTLKFAAKEAESRDLEAITIEDIKSAARYVRKYRLSYLLGKLNYHQKIVYEILKKNKIMESGKLFEEYRKKAGEPVVDRSYRNNMERMEDLGLVRSEGSGRWKRYEIVV